MINNLIPIDVNPDQEEEKKSSQSELIELDDLNIDCKTSKSENQTKKALI